MTPIEQQLHRLIHELRDEELPPHVFIRKLMQFAATGYLAREAVLVRGHSQRDDVSVNAWWCAEKEDEPQRWVSQLRQKIHKCISANRSAVLTFQDGEMKRFAHIHPIDATKRGMALIFVSDKAILKSLYGDRWHDEVVLTLLHLYETRITLQNRIGSMGRMRYILDTFIEVNKQKNFVAMAMSLCNKMASEWQCDRVSLGILKKGNIQLQAINHMDDFSTRMQEAQGIVQLMEESLDQSKEILYPAPRDAGFSCRLHEKFSRSHGNSCIVTLPIRTENATFGSLCLERPQEKPFSVKELESLRLSVDLITPRLNDLHRSSGKLRSLIRRLSDNPLHNLFGATHTGWKLAILALISASVFFSIAEDDFRLSGSFRIDIPDRRALVAPQDGILAEVHFRPGQKVTSKQLLASLDTRELVKQQLALSYELLRYEKEADIARGEGKFAEVQLAQARIAEGREKQALLQLQIDQAQLISPIDGIIISEQDFQQLNRPPVNKGDQICEIGKPENMALILEVPEDQIVHLQKGSLGEAATVAYPDQRFEIRIEEITPFAKVVDGRNIYQVRASIIDKPVWLKPGMEGVGKVTVGKRKLIWIWMRKAINWLRLEFWF